MEIRDCAAQDAVGLAELLRTRQVSATEVEDVARRAIEAVEPQLSATVGPLLDAPLESSDDRAVRRGAVRHEGGGART
ncbi:MAG: hypothetical protein R3C15_09220 [Thermoleophilia bacterium]